jgi:hypothetical protein
MRTPEEALCIAVLDGLASEDLTTTEKAGHIAAQVDAWRAHVATSGQQTEKGRKLDKSFRKLLVNAGHVPSIRKSIYNDALKALGEELRVQGDTDAKAYVKALETAEGRDLFDLYKAAPPDPPQDEVVEPPPPKGEANQELERLTANHLRAHPELARDAFGRPKEDGGWAAAHMAMQLHPDNRSLMARVKAEDLRHTQRTPEAREVRVEREIPASRSYGASIGRRGP